MTEKRLKKKRIALISAVILCVTAFLLCSLKGEDSFFNLEPKTASQDFIRFIDVGQGESILIMSKGQTALLDTGTTDSALKLSRTLFESGVEQIDVLMLSHLHIDHTGGVAQVFTDFEVKNLILPELSTFSEGIHSAQLAIDKVTRAGGQVYSAIQGMNFKIGNFDVTVLAKYAFSDDENNRSLVIMAENEGNKFLFTGDMEIDAEKKLLKERLDLSCDVLKVAHHGSSTSSSPDFLNAAAPSFAVISCGNGNSYGHPHRETLNALKTRNTEILRTDLNGDITFYIENGKLKKETEK